MASERESESKHPLLIAVRTGTLEEIQDILADDCEFSDLELDILSEAAQTAVIHDKLHLLPILLQHAIDTFEDTNDDIPNTIRSHILMGAVKAKKWHLFEEYYPKGENDYDVPENPSDPQNTFYMRLMRKSVRHPSTFYFLLGKRPRESLIKERLMWLIQWATEAESFHVAKWAVNLGKQDDLIELLDTGYAALNPEYDASEYHNYLGYPATAEEKQRKEYFNWNIVRNDDPPNHGPVPRY